MIESGSNNLKKNHERNEQQGFQEISPNFTGGTGDALVRL